MNPNLLDHAIRQYPAPVDAYQRVLKVHGRRKTRNRIGTIALAALLFAGTTIAFVRAFDRGAPMPEAPTIDARNVAALTLAWAAKPALTPVIADGIVYSNAGPKAYDVNCEPNSVYMCAPRWNAGSGAARGGITVGDGYVVTTHSVAPHVSFSDVAAYREGCSGSSRCSYHLIQIGGGPVSAPTIADGTVFFEREEGIGDRPTLYAISETCFRDVSSPRPNCAAAWWARAPYSRTAPIVLGGVVFVGGAGTPMAAYSASCSSPCQPLWTTPPGVPNTTSAASVDASHLYLTTPRGLVALPATCTSTSTCRPSWRWDTTTPLQRPISGGGAVFVPSRDTGTVYVFDPGCAADGNMCTPAWTVDLPEPITSGSPIVSNDVAFAEGRSGVTYAIPTTCDAATCAILATIGLRSPQPLPPDAVPAVGEGAVVVPKSDGLFAYRVGTPGPAVAATATKPRPFAWGFPAACAAALILFGGLVLGARRRTAKEFSPSISASARAARRRRR